MWLLLMFRYDPYVGSIDIQIVLRCQLSSFDILREYYGCYLCEFLHLSKSENYVIIVAGSFSSKPQTVDEATKYTCMSKELIG